MSKNVKVNDTSYSGISIVQLPLSDGSGNAQFKDVDEISEPTGTKTINTNGTHDVKNYASAVVNVPTGGGGITPSGTKQITENGEHDVTNYAKVNVNVESSGGSGYSIDDLAGGAPTGEITITASKVKEYAFAYKTGITKAIINGASVVDSSSFSGCTGLTEVEFQTAVQGGSYAFNGCTNLKKVTWKGKPNFIATTCFNGCTNLTDIYVPWGKDETNPNGQLYSINAPWGSPSTVTIHYNS